MPLSLSNVCSFINNSSALPKIKYAALVVFLLACQCISILYIFVLIPQGEVRSVLEWLMWFCNTLDLQFHIALLRVFALFLFGTSALLSPLFLLFSLCYALFALCSGRAYETAKVLNGITTYIVLTALTMFTLAAPGTTIFERAIAPTSALLVRMSVIFFIYLFFHRALHERSSYEIKSTS